MHTYLEQLELHLDFLRQNGLDVEALDFGRVIRCRAIGQTQGRGELAYCCNVNEMNKGFVGLVTWCRNVSGEKLQFKTYGLGPNGNERAPDVKNVESNEIFSLEQKEAAKRAYGFWQNSFPSGLSSYLNTKGVGSYGIRFRVNDYGNVAVVPMRDEEGWLWGYQLLNADGSKRMPKGARTKGLFHALQELKDGDPIGIAESYVTAATCLELSGISTVCCFSCENMTDVALIIRKKYPNSSIILFSDNDRHLEERGLPNNGVCAALDAMKQAGSYVGMAQPDFDDLRASKDASDWNDLVQLNGVVFAKEQMLSELERLNLNWIT